MLVGIVFVPYQAGRHLDHAHAQRDTILIQQQQPAFGRDGDDHRCTARLDAIDVFPTAVT
jgi:hypothetical protein